MRTKILPSFDLVGSIVNEIVLIEQNKERYTQQEFYRVVWYRLVSRFPQLVILDESIAHHPDDYDIAATEFGLVFFELIKEIIKMRDEYYKEEQ